VSDARTEALQAARAAREWDLLVVGGGASGLGVALDAAARGFSVLLLESHDFAHGTSSRATKLVHGGVRYLAQGRLGLVREALRERATLLANAPQLAQPLAFVVPGYRWWEPGFYGLGLKAYEALAGARSLGPTRLLSAARLRTLLPGLRSQGLRGGVLYWDGQFDDARLAVLLARTAHAQGAVLLNHCPVVELLREAGRVRGVLAQDGESGEHLRLRARCVVNATGVWVDALRELDREAQAPLPAPVVAPSQGVHLVVDRRFWPCDHALLVPRTADGRVLFALPWLGKTVLGTTDTPRADVPREPRPFAHEVDFILREAARCLASPPTRADVRSLWVGLRPLVRTAHEDAPTRALSREHTVLVARSGLVSVTGGKWTTYRAMAEDVLQHCIDRGLLPARARGVTEHLALLGADGVHHVPLTQPPGEHLYGSEAAALRVLPGADRWLWRDGAGGLSEAMVRFAVRHEFARDVEDVLARRCRLLFLDACEAARQADAVAAIVADELGAGFDGAASASAFKALAEVYADVP
jgi:glycerol-3-phosphate dehydrogenase